MNIELEEVVQDLSDDALEQAACGAQGVAMVQNAPRGAKSFRSSFGSYFC